MQEMMDSTKKPLDDEPLSEAILTILAESNSDLHHAVHTTRLSLALFEKLQTFHKLGRRERLLLEIAAMLHDIGWSRTTNGGHHKISRDMILESDLPGIVKAELNICAQTARYHNKTEPDEARHRAFAKLKRKERGVVSWLAALLRVADGLDCNHDGKTALVGCKIDKEAITLLLFAEQDCTAEIRGAKRKAGLLERLTKRKLVFLKCV